MLHVCMGLTHLTQGENTAWADGCHYCLSLTTLSATCRGVAGISAVLRQGMGLGDHRGPCQPLPCWDPVSWCLCCAFGLGEARKKLLRGGHGKAQDFIRTEYLLLYLSNRANTQRLGRGVAEGALLSALLVINLGTHPAPGLRSAGVVRQGGRAVALPDTASCEISPQCRRIFAFPDA